MVLLWWHTCNDLTTPFNNLYADSKIESSSDKYVFRYRQSNVRQLLAASNYWWACGDQIPVHYSDKEAVFGSSRKLGGDTEYLIDGSEKHICRSTFEF